MALIKCPDCERQVSDQAPACPSCGRPMASSMVIGTEKPIELTSKRFKKISLVAAGLVLCGVVMVVEGRSPTGERNPMAGFGGLLVIAGVVTYVVNRVRIWWHHK